MSAPFLGEIRLVAFNYAPKGWALCAGQLLSIAQFQALFSILGTTYGGNGQTTFNLPDFRGRVPLHFGQSPGTSNRTLGEAAGSASVTLTNQQIPAHIHVANASSAPAMTGNPANAALAQAPVPNFGDTGDAAVFGNVASVGSGQPHENRQPYLGLSFIIALQGVYPSRN